MTNHALVGERPIESPALRVELRPLVRLVYLWMGFGLLVTGFMSALTVAHPMIRALLTNDIVVYAAFIIELVLVARLSARIQQMSFLRAVLVFTLYAAINGFTLGIVFLVFSLGSIFLAFATTAALFAVMAIIGSTTKIDLTKYTSYFLMGLIGLLITMLINLVIDSRPFDLVISIAAVVLFTALTAHDTQKIKELAAHSEIQASADLTLKLSILGALILYLDFINLFLHLLNLFGDSDS
jgi:uncharacterized protein